jgi:hypothetical protein
VLNRGTIDWQKIATDPSTTQCYNDTLANLLNNATVNSPDMPIEVFDDVIKKQERTRLYLSDHHVTTGSTSMLMNLPHLLKNAIKYSMLSALPPISPPPSLILCAPNSGASTRM